jgi:hypothetical protein
MELILKPNRVRYVGLLVGCLLFIAEGVYLVGQGHKAHQASLAKMTFVAGWAEILFFGVGVVVACLSFLPGSGSLKLDSAGFTVCSLFRRHSYRWYEVDSFEVGRLLRVMGQKVVVFNFSKLYRGHESLRKFNSRIVGYEGAMADNYGMSVDKLAATLNEWRQRAVGTSP